MSNPIINPIFASLSIDRSSERAVYVIGIPVEAHGMVVDELGFT
ncbi:hypothetical protein [Pedobacter sp. N36a]|nr:hypothetical protein [Pedobacter sp. N36a]